MQMPFQIARGVLGRSVFYKCPCCAADLKSQFKEIGTSDNCPLCGAAFVVPGPEDVCRRKAEKEERRQATNRRKASTATVVKNTRPRMNPGRPDAASVRPIPESQLIAQRAAERRKQCSSCKEWIDVEAILCPHCRSDQRVLNQVANGLMTCGCGLIVLGVLGTLLLILLFGL